MKVVNLSSRPFLNTRPVVRLATVLWVVGGLLFVGNLWSYGSHAAKYADSQHQLEEIDAQIRHNQDEIRRLDSALSGLALAEQNEQVAFLNTLIARRTFPWSLLFEQLEGILPQDVRLLEVRPEIQLAALPGVRQTRATASDRPRRAPRGETRRGEARRAAPEGDQVRLEIIGAARGDDALLDFLDALFASPHFDQPVLHQESRETTGDIRFQLDVLYLLAPAEAETSAPEVVLGAAESEPAAAETAPEEAAALTGTVDSPAQPGVPTLRRELGAPAPPPLATSSGERPVYLTPAQKRRLEAEAAAGSDEPAARSGEPAARSAATAPAGVVFGTAQPPAQTGQNPATASPQTVPTGRGPTGEPAAVPEAAGARTPLTRARPTLERPRLDPTPVGLAPAASASPRLRQGGRP